MALTKEKLSIQLQTQLGMSKREAHQLVHRLFEIIKGTLSRGDDLLISGFGRFSVKQKRMRRGRSDCHGSFFMDQITFDAQEV